MAIALLLGQMDLLEHEYDFAAPKPGHTCMNCLHAAPLGHAMTGASEFTFPLLRNKTDYIYVLLPHWPCY